MSAMFNMTIGLPGSGANYLAWNNPSTEDEVISTDIAKSQLSKVASYVTNERLLGYIINRASQALFAGKDVWLDGTNLSITWREKIIKKISVFNDVVFNAYVYAVPVDECVETSKIYDHDFTMDDMKKYIRRFEIPTFGEGFDNITIMYSSIAHVTYDIYGINASHGLGTIKFKDPEEAIGELGEEWLMDSSTKKRTIAQHSIAVSKDMEHDRTKLRDFLITVGLLHDLGKPMAKEYYGFEKDGTPIVLYRHSDNISSYLSLFYKIPNYNNLEAAMFISVNDKYQRGSNAISLGIKRRIGADLYRALDNFEFADISC